MSRRAAFPLMAKMLAWLLVHLLVLGLAFVLFLSWQLHTGVDSLLSATAGGRLESFGNTVSAEMRSSPRYKWAEVLEKYAKEKEVEIYLQLQNGTWIGNRPQLSPEIAEKLQRSMPQMPPRNNDGGPNRYGDPPERRSMEGPPPPQVPMLGTQKYTLPESRPVFFIKDDGYWAGVVVPLFNPPLNPPLQGVMLIRSQTASADGLFFELRPWIYGGLTVLVVSLLLWVPFALGISLYVRRLVQATDDVATGKFKVDLPSARSDELGVLGRSIEQMAQRLDHLVAGQKRFLGDVAHELCAPLARIRTGLGILEHGLTTPQTRTRLASIEEDADELSQLISEVLTFTRASAAPETAKRETVDLRDLVEQTAQRECPANPLLIEIPENFSIQVDRSLFSRAIANILRNAQRHAGPEAHVTVSARKLADQSIEITFSDDGPGVEAKDLPRLFEPFFRPDASRTRDTGGSGLGLAIVRTAIEACHGSIEARAAYPTGLTVAILLQNQEI
jgi:two-component system, OmpR family, sensor histidine kinase CpxA